MMVTGGREVIIVLPRPDLLYSVVTPLSCTVCCPSPHLTSTPRSQDRPDRSLAVQTAASSHNNRLDQAELFTLDRLLPTVSEIGKDSLTPCITERGCKRLLVSQFVSHSAV